MTDMVRTCSNVLVGKPERKRPLGRPRRRWEDNIKMDLREVGCDPRDWIAVAEDRDQWRAYVRAAFTAVGQAVACAPVTQRARVRIPIGKSFLGEIFSGFFLTCKTNVGKL